MTPTPSRLQFSMVDLVSNVGVVSIAMVSIATVDWVRIRMRVHCCWFQFSMVDLVCRAQLTTY